jgi:hypothetical protein
VYTQASNHLSSFLNEIICRTGLLDRLDDFSGNLYEFSRFGRGNPRKVQPSRFQSHMLNQILEQSELASCEIITFQVMAVAGVSPGNPDTVGTVPEGGEDEFRAHPGGAGNPDNPDIGRVLETADACQVCRAVAAPVAQECGYLRLPIGHGHHSVLSISGFSILCALSCREP